MQRLKLLFLALVAVAALLSTIVAAASAAPPLFLPDTVSEGFTGTGGQGILGKLPGGLTNEIIASTSVSEGKLEAGKMLGPFHIEFTNLKAGGLILCTALGDTTDGVVLLLGEYHLVYDKLGSGAELGVGILFLVKPAHLECGTKLFVVEGEVLCLIKPVEVLTKHFEVVCEDTSSGSGDPKETVYWNEAGTEVKMGANGLLITENEGAGVMSSIHATALILFGIEHLLM